MMFGANRAPCSAAVQAPEALADRDDVVVDGLRQPDDGQVVVVLLQVGREVGGGGVGVVAADGVQDVHAVGRQLVGGHLQRVLALGFTRLRFTRSSALVSLTRLLPIGDPPNRRRTPAPARTSSVTSR